jgi:hypothetical protein
MFLKIQTISQIITKSLKLNLNVLHIIMLSFLKACFGLSNNHTNHSNKTIGSRQRCKKCTCKATKLKQKQKSECVVFPPFFHDFMIS